MPPISDALLPTILADWLGCDPTDSRVTRLLTALPFVARGLGDLITSPQGFGTAQITVEHGRVSDVQITVTGRYKPPRGA